MSKDIIRFRPISKFKLHCEQLCSFPILAAYFTLEAESVQMYSPPPPICIDTQLPQKYEISSVPPTYEGKTSLKIVIRHHSKKTSLGDYYMPSMEKLSISVVCTSDFSSWYISSILFSCSYFYYGTNYSQWQQLDPMESLSFMGAECTHLCLSIMYCSNSIQHPNPLLPFLFSSALPLPLLPR